MADGGGQCTFGFRPLAVSLLRPGEIVVDLFAGGGGASEALELALGRPVDVAVNHDAIAIGLHAANHPHTLHVREDIYRADPLALVARRLVGWMHASPDCTHHSQANGGQPRDAETRSLSWALVKWVGKLQRIGCAPRIISLENVEQILKWGPLIAKRCKLTGRVVTLEKIIDPSTGKKVHRVAAPGEYVPRRNQYLVPDKKRTGKTWRQFVRALEAFGYVVDWRKLKACDYGAGTSRKRLFMLARRDGEPIRWPKPTHGEAPLQPMVSAADCIEWDKPGRSIFDRKTPLTRNTIVRLLDGARRGSWPQQYIAALEALRDGRAPKLGLSPAEFEEVRAALGHGAGMVMAAGAGGVPRPLSQPVPTITAGGQGACGPQLIRPVLVHKFGSDGGRLARSVDDLVPTATCRGAGSVAEPVMAPYYGSGSGKTGQRVSTPMPAATTHARFGVAEPVIVSTCNSSSTSGVRGSCAPLRTVTTAKGGDMAVAEPVLVEYRIDILYRMLNPRELFTAQGFRRDYEIYRTADGRKLTIGESVRMVGNSVSPPPLTAIASENLDRVADWRMAA